MEDTVTANVPWADSPAGAKQIIHIYVDDLGTLKVLEVKSDNARSLLRAIGTEGYLYNDNRVLQYYPAHTIRRVDLVGGLRTSYPSTDVTLANKEIHANSKN